MTRNWLCLPGLLLAALVLVPVIAGESNIHQHRQLQTGTVPHQLHDAKLREIMLRLNALVSYSEQPHLPLNNDSKEFLRELIDTAALVAESSLTLKDEENTGQLPPQEQARFHELAEQLYQQAVAIEINARNMNIDEMNKAFGDMNQVCISCHRLFRAL